MKVPFILIILEITKDKKQKEAKRGHLINLLSTHLGLSIPCTVILSLSVAPTGDTSDRPDLNTYTPLCLVSACAP